VSTSPIVEDAMTLPRRLAMLFIAALCGAAPAAAQYPSKPVRIVLQFPAGGSTDAAARILGQALSQSMGQPVIVENRPGADGAIAAESVVKAAPDGYTVFLASNTPMMQVPLLRKAPPYDPLTDFTPISDVGRYIFILVVNPALPVKSVAELIAHARANPGRLNFGSFSGVGQLVFAQMRASTNADMLLIPYKGEAPTIVDVIAGRTHMTFATPASTLAHIKEGKLRPLAIASSKRSVTFPDLPTVSEEIKGFDFSGWFMLLAPTGTPDEIVNRLSRDVGEAMGDERIREMAPKLGFEIETGSPDAARQFLAGQLDLWKGITTELGLKPQ